MDYQNILQQIQDAIGVSPEKFNILQEQIDVNLQMEYFDLSRKVKSDGFDKQEILEQKDLLFEEAIPHDDDLKLLLVRLASLTEVEAYRAIEGFAKQAQGDLRQWAVLAEQESRMMLERTLLEENQVFIATGLGGKGTKMRFFAVLTSRNKEEFTPVQKKIITSEFEFALKNNQAELEKLEFSKYFVTILSVIPLEAKIREIFKQAIEQCNELGNFLAPQFLMTNVKTFSIDEIEEFFESEHGKEMLEKFNPADN